MKRNIFVILLLSLFLSACDQGEPQGYSIISVPDAYQLVKEQDSDTLFLDVRTLGEYQSGHVPHAKLIPVQTLANRLNELPKDKKIVVYCEAGVRAARAAELLVNQGYAHVKSMKESMRGWRSAGLPTEK